MSTWNHDALAEDLAGHLRGYARPAMIWTNMQLGPQGSPRPDVYTLEPTFMRIKAVAFECKVSRADFLCDVGKGKALGYLVYAGALVFATPKGLVRKDELPIGAGLIERGETSWRWVKKPTVNPLTELPFECWMKLLIDGRGRDQGMPQHPKPRPANEWVQQQRARKMLGDELGQLMADRDAAAMRLRVEIDKANQETDSARAMREESDRLRRERVEVALKDLRRELDEVAALVGMSSGTPAYALLKALRELRPERDRNRLDDAARALRDAAAAATRHADAIERSSAELTAVAKAA